MSESDKFPSAKTIADLAKKSRRELLERDIRKCAEEGHSAMRARGLDTAQRDELTEAGYRLVEVAERSVEIWWENPT